jgi:hypothetical protein
MSAPRVTLWLVALAAAVICVTLTACARESHPVCGVDHRVYDSEQAARGAGVELSITGGCKTVIVDFIPCGAHYCDARRDYCEIYLSDVPELPTSQTCRSLLAGCKPSTGSQPACDCFPRETPCLTFCGPTFTGGTPGFHLTCQGVKVPPDRGAKAPAAAASP